MASISSVDGRSRQSTFAREMATPRQRFAPLERPDVGDSVQWDASTRDNPVERRDSSPLNTLRQESRQERSQSPMSDVRSLDGFRPAFRVEWLCALKRELSENIHHEGSELRDDFAQSIGDLNKGLDGGLERGLERCLVEIKAEISRGMSQIRQEFTKALGEIRKDIRETQEDIDKSIKSAMECAVDSAAEAAAQAAAQATQHVEASAAGSNDADGHVYVVSDLSSKQVSQITDRDLSQILISMRDQLPNGKSRTSSKGSLDGSPKSSSRVASPSKSAAPRARERPQYEPFTSDRLPEPFTSGNKSLAAFTAQLRSGDSPAASPSVRTRSHTPDRNSDLMATYLSLRSTSSSSKPRWSTSGSKSSR